MIATKEGEAFGADDRVEIGFECKRCGAAARLKIEARGHREEITRFVDRVASACGRYHGTISPVCCSKELDLLIPYGEGGAVGAPGATLPPQAKNDE